MKLLQLEMGLRLVLQNYILHLTNKRIIIAGSIFGFWSYKLMSRSIYFDKSISNKKENILNITTNESKDGLLLILKYHNIEIFLDNPESV